MDFALTRNSGTGAIDQSFDQVTSILNNIIISLSIKRGSWWHDPTFGLMDRPRAKNTDQTARLIRQDYKQALQWLLDSGRATAIDIRTWRDETNKNRLNILVTATQADGRIISYETFKEVV